MNGIEPEFNKNEPHYFIIHPDPAGKGLNQTKKTCSFGHP
jgi:hypothetical protein